MLPEQNEMHSTIEKTILQFHTLMALGKRDEIVEATQYVQQNADDCHLDMESRLIWRRLLQVLNQRLREL